MRAALRRLCVVLAGLAGLLHGAAAAEPDRPVDMLLVLAIDASGSTRNGDFRAQLEGHASAFRDERVVSALTSGPRARVAVAAIVWSDDAQQWRCVEWTLIATPADAARVAARLDRCPYIGGGTSIGGALRSAREEIGWSPYTAERRVIDISANERSAWEVEPSRVLAIRDGITINALVIQTLGEDLIPYFSRFVAGGPGAFVVAATAETYTQSLMWKLQVETAGRARTPLPGEVRLASGQPAPMPLP